MSTRRDILRTGAAFGGAGLLSSVLPGFSAAAQSADGYKALVCVFLAGGMDGHDTVIPQDPESYAEHAATRARLLDLYAEAGDDSRTRDALTALGQQSDGRAMGMPRQMQPLADHYADGRLAVLANVGPLVVPTTAEDAKAERVPLPARLMSHNDQQSTWQAMGPEGTVSGWGGRMADLVASGQDFSAVSIAGNPVFLAGETSRPFVMGAGGVRTVHATRTNWAYGSRDVPAAFEAHLAASAAAMDSWLASDYQSAQRRAVASVNDLAAMTGNTEAGDEVALEGNKLSKQLAMVAKMISLRGQLGVRRQVFFVKMGGFDTHDGQHERLPGLQAQLASAMSSFYAWTTQQGVAQDVTAFTASDFGRTLTVNATGTDHGWGGHHLVLGGAVAGGRIEGLVPPAVPGHAQDFGRGRMVPTTATVQYAASLGRWFGLSDGQLADVLPGLGRFDANGARLF